MTLFPHSMKNAYIGEVWTPNASRTLLYLPLESNTNDYSGNNRTCTPTSVTFTTVGWVQSAHVGTTGWIIVTPTTFITHSLNYKTTSCLIYVTELSSSNRRNVWEFAIQNTNMPLLNIKESTNWVIKAGSWYTFDSEVPNKLSINTWTHIVETMGDWVQKIYINWELASTSTYSSWYTWGSRPNSYEQSQTILNSRKWVSTSQWLNWNAREIIFENILWSDEDVQNYYQQIRAKLWI